MSKYYLSQRFHQLRYKISSANYCSFLNYKALTDNIQACLNGSKSPAQAMGDAQSETDRILRPYKKT